MGDHLTGGLCSSCPWRLDAKHYCQGQSDSDEYVPRATRLAAPPTSFLRERASPKTILDKIELLVAKSPVEFQAAFEGIQAWACYAYITRGPVPPRSNQSQVSMEWRDFPHDAVYSNSWTT